MLPRLPLQLAAELEPAFYGLVVVVAAILPTALKSFMLTFMATVLRMIDAKFDSSLWAESKKQRSQMDSYVFFMALIGFFVPLVGGNLLAAVISGDVTSVATDAANSVGAMAYTNGMLILLKLGGLVSGTTRVVPVVVYRVKLEFLAKTDYDKAALLDPAPFNVAPAVGWESFAFLLAAVYMPVAPYVTVVRFSGVPSFVPGVVFCTSCSTRPGERDLAPSQGPQASIDHQTGF